mmetsp:Transcript_15554/g.17914  ORF Transcript_15554/g.17914 Transcript_15554/m.17914 type:complete len:202 (+) Transcript_15554:652-1257(+)
MIVNLEALRLTPLLLLQPLPILESNPAAAEVVAADEEVLSDDLKLLFSLTIPLVEAALASVAVVGAGAKGRVVVGKIAKLGSINRLSNKIALSSPFTRDVKSPSLLIVDDNSLKLLDAAPPPLPAPPNAVNTQHPMLPLPPLLALTPVPELFPPVVETRELVELVNPNKRACSNPAAVVLALGPLPPPLPEPLAVTVFPVL